MYRETKWENGGLWVKSSPRGGWYPASTAETIGWLYERMLALEIRVRELEGGPR